MVVAYHRPSVLRQACEGTTSPTLALLHVLGCECARVGCTTPESLVVLNIRQAEEEEAEAGKRLGEEAEDHNGRGGESALF